MSKNMGYFFEIHLINVTLSYSIYNDNYGFAAFVNYPFYIYMNKIITNIIHSLHFYHTINICYYNKIYSYF